MTSADVVTADVNLRVPANRVSRRAIGYWTLRAVATWVGIGALEFVIFFVGGSPIPHGRWAVVTGSIVIALAYILGMPRWRYAVHRWEVSPTAVYTQTGWFTVERRIAPVSRIQTVDSHRGPLEQLLKLSNVTVTTASAAGPLKIHGLPRDTADRLVAELTSQTADNTGDAT